MTARQVDSPRKAPSSPQERRTVAGTTPDTPSDVRVSKQVALGQSTKPVHIRDLTPDPKNARRHSPQNVGLIADSLRAVGAGRSIVIDEDGVILAGNGLVEAAAEAGITKVQVVEADGETVIAVRRTGLSKMQKQQLAVFDNRTAELAEWNVDVLRDLAADGLDLAAFEFPPGLVETPCFAPVGEDEQGRLDQKASITCPKCGHEFRPK